eukprot:SAG31_NODE_5379_length_2575_cov_5.130856_4_plen_134_part_00
MLVCAAAGAAAAGPPGVSATKVQLPPWPPTYQMNLSTIIQPCNDSGPFDPAFGARFGVADYDWSNQKQLWVNTKPMDCERLLVAQAELNRKINPKSRAFVCEMNRPAARYRTLLRLPCPALLTRCSLLLRMKI